jgi:hypothetical protein
MRLPLLYLLLAALCAWATLQLETPEMSQAIIAAERRQPERTAPIAQRSPELSVRAITAPASAALFRGVTVPAASREPEPGQSFALVGLAGVGPARVAFLRDDADRRTYSARIGESVLEWVVEDFSERCVVLRKARRRVNVCLS